MTSEQMERFDHVLTDADGKPEDAAVAQCFWLRELAIQFARFNERNDAMDEYNREMDAKDAETERRKPELLNQVIDKANAAMDRIAAPSPFFAPPMPGHGKPE